MTTRRRLTLLMTALLFGVLACNDIPDPVLSLDASGQPRLPDDASLPEEDGGRDLLCPGGEPAMGELCNRKDDDCDGRVDEGFAEDCDSPSRCMDGDQRRCGTDCGSGNQVCTNGIWSECNITDLNEEMCDDLDNDCDGQFDEGLVCSSLDMGVDAASIPDAAVPDAAPDMARPIPDMGPPPCPGNEACPGGELCLGGSCVSALPGTFVLTFLDARYNDEVGDPLGGEPDVFVTVSLNGSRDPIHSTDSVDGNDGFVQWSVADNNAQLRTQLEPNDTLRICLFDADGFLKGGDDAMGCVRGFDVEDLVDIIQRYDGNRPANSPHWALVTPSMERDAAITSIRFTVERFFNR